MLKSLQLLQLNDKMMGTEILLILQEQQLLHMQAAEQKLIQITLLQMPKMRLPQKSMME